MYNIQNVPLCLHISPLPILLTDLKAFSNNSKSVSGFEVLTALLMIHMLWDIKTILIGKSYQSFGEALCLNI
jgi:hypothetical protein